MPAETQWAGYGQPAGATMRPHPQAPASPNPAAGGTYFAPPPGTDQAAQDYTGANLAYQRALARFNQQRTGLLQQYGYKGTVDPTTGLMTNVGVDSGNSYGALQQLLHAQANEDTQAEYAAQDRGLVGGLAHQGEQELSYGHHGQSSALANSLFGSLSDVNSQQLDAKDALDQALWQLAHAATTDAVDNGDFNPADVMDDPGSSSGNGGGSSGARTTASAKIGSPAQIAKASMAAKTAAKKAGKSQPAQALAARSAGMNAAYGLATKAAAVKKPVAKPAPYKGRH